MGVELNQLLKQIRLESSCYVVRKRTNKSIEKDVKAWRFPFGVSEKRVAEVLAQFTTQYPLTEQLIESSFLLSDTKKTYLTEYLQRRNRLKEMR